MKLEKNQVKLRICAIHHRPALLSILRRNCSTIDSMTYSEAEFNLPHEVPFGQPLDYVLICDLDMARRIQNEACKGAAMTLIEIT